MSGGGVEGLDVTEELVVSKVSELLETLDHVKRYNALLKALTKVAFVVVCLISACLFLGAASSFLYPAAVESEFLMALFAFLLVPVLGIVLGYVYVREKVNDVGSVRRRDELSGGFPEALQLLLEWDWEATLEEVSVGKLGYALYGLLKTVAYIAAVLFGLELVGNLFAWVVFGSTNVSFTLFLGFLTFPVVFLILGRDLLRRYKEIQALDMLLLELRWFSLEFRRAEFQT
ncbi:MAG: hypothetical protein NWF04_03110 [Candidatus Bathyarchaeota archaeon]|nr:hypothetical protein [Candidatus Bathyarchaeota archaeon]